MAKYSESGQHFHIVASPRLARGVHALYVLALLACWLNSLALWIKLFSSAVVIGIGLASARAGKTAGFDLLYSVNQGWSVLDAEQEYQSISIKPTTVISRWVVFLHFSFNDKVVRSRMILKDALLDDDYRRLIVKLKLTGYRES